MLVDPVDLARIASVRSEGVDESRLDGPLPPHDSLYTIERPDGGMIPRSSAAIERPGRAELTTPISTDMVPITAQSAERDLPSGRRMDNAYARPAHA